MRRTLLAVGFAVLASMLLAPHKEGWDFLPWYNNWHWFPAFWVTNRNPILLMPFMGQTAFGAVLAAMIVNIRWRRKPRGEKPHQENPHQEKPLQARDWLSPAGMFTAAVIAVAVLTILYVLVRTALPQ
jgi:hypothetical protein